MLILGIVIGAGFASGQEVVVFFAQYGFISLFFLIIFFFLFFYGLKLFLEFGQKEKYAIDYANNKAKFHVLDNFSLIVFVVIGSSMLASANELLNSIVYEFSLPVWGLILTIFSTLVVALGLKWLLNLSAYLIPVIIVSIIYVCIKSSTVSNISSPAFSSDFFNVFLLFLSAISYACCNLVTANKILFNSGKNLTKKQIKIISIVVPLILTLILGLIIVCILINNNMVLFAELPMIQMAFLISSPVGYFFSGILFISIITTLFSTQYSFVSVLSNKIKSRKKIISLLISMFLLYSLSLLGFGEIITYFYPLIGAGGLILLIFIRDLSLKTCLNPANNKIHSSR